MGGCRRRSNNVVQIADHTGNDPELVRWRKQSSAFSRHSLVIKKGE